MILTYFNFDKEINTIAVISFPYPQKSQNNYISFLLEDTTAYNVKPLNINPLYVKNYQNKRCFIYYLHRESERIDNFTSDILKYIQEN